jgi:hypothetical protein
MIIFVAVSVGGLSLVVLPFELAAIVVLAVVAVPLRIIGLMSWQVVIVWDDGRITTERVCGVFAAWRRICQLRSAECGH